MAASLRRFQSPGSRTFVRIQFRALVSPLAARRPPPSLRSFKYTPMCRGAQFSVPASVQLFFWLFRRLPNTASQGFRLAITMAVIYANWTESARVSSVSSRRKAISRPLRDSFRLRNARCASLSAPEMRAARCIAAGTPSRVVRERVRVATSIQRISSLAPREFQMRALFPVFISLAAAIHFSSSFVYNSERVNKFAVRRAHYIRNALSESIASELKQKAIFRC